MKAFLLCLVCVLALTSVSHAADLPSLPVTKYVTINNNGRPALVILAQNLTRPLTDAEVLLIQTWNLSLDVLLGAPIIYLGYPEPPVFPK